MADEQDLIERLDGEPDEPTLFDHFPFAHGQTDGSLAVVCACGVTFHDKDRKAAKAAWAVHARGALAALRSQPQVTEEAASFIAQVIEDPNQQLCCDGKECGCQGSTVGQYAAWAMNTRSQVTEEMVAQAMQDAWNDICSDTGYHPVDITREGSITRFSPNHWARGTWLCLTAALGDSHDR